MKSRIGRFLRGICVSVAVGIAVGAAVVTGSTAVYAADVDTENEVVSDVPGDTEQEEQEEFSAHIDLAKIHGIGGYDETDQESEDEASLAGTTVFKYDARIANAIKSLKTTLDVSGMGITKWNVESIYRNICDLHPEIVYIKDAMYYWHSDGEVFKLVISYEPNAATMKTKLAAAVNKVNREINIKNMKPAEIVLAYHEYITSTVTYAEKAPTGSGGDHRYDMYGVLVNRQAVCQGYAETMQYFLMRAGIPCALATSVNINHAWNVVRIDGKWYHVDATWDDPTPNIPGQSDHKYFLISENRINNLTQKAGARYDMKITGAWKGNYVKATDTKYEHGQMWNSVDKVMYYRNGYWYSIRQGKSYDTFLITKHRFSTGGKKVILSAKDTWYQTNGSFYTAQYGSIFLAQEMLYFSTSACVGRINLDSPKYEYTVLYNIRSVYESGINIYAMGWDAAVPVLWVSNTPSCEVRDSYLLDPCFKHSWNKGTVTKKPTYSSKGVRRYTCTKCKFEKNVVIPILKVGRVSAKSEPTSKGIKITWEKVPGASWYRVYKLSKDGTYKHLRSVKTLSVLDASVASGGKYSYRIQACNNYSTGTAAQVTRLFLGTAKAKVSNEVKGVEVAWNRVKGATSYKIYRKTKTGSYKLMKIVGSSTSLWLDTTAAACKQYTYAVMPYRGTTGGSYTAATTVYLKAPAVGIAKDPKGVKVKCGKVVGAEVYYIFRIVPGGQWKQLAALRKTDAFSWIDTTAQKGQTYYYSVTTTRGTYIGAVSTPKKITR